MDFTDRLLNCTDCGTEFVFTAGEQLFFFEKQFKNDPKRCKPCKSKRTPAVPKPGMALAVAGAVRIETRTECSACGIGTTVPFKPTQGRPVLCRACFQNRQVSAPGALVTSSAMSASAEQFTTATAQLIAAASGADHHQAASGVERSTLPLQV